MNFFLLFSKVGVKNIRRCESLNDSPIFIRALADIVKSHLSQSELCSKQLPLRCPKYINETCGPMKQFLNPILSSSQMMEVVFIFFLLKYIVARLLKKF